MDRQYWERDFYGNKNKSYMLEKKLSRSTERILILRTNRSLNHDMGWNYQYLWLESISLISSVNLYSKLLYKMGHYFWTNST